MSKTLQVLKSIAAIVVCSNSTSGSGDYFSTPSFGLNQPQVKISFDLCRIFPVGNALQNIKPYISCHYGTVDHCIVDKLADLGTMIEMLSLCQHHSRPGRYPLLHPRRHSLTSIPVFRTFMGLSYRNNQSMN